MTPEITMPKFFVSCSKQTDCLMILFVIVLFVSTGLSETTYDVKNPPKWKVLADRRLSRLKRSVQIPHPKNVIIFIGDGMSVGTVTATRYTKAYDQGKPAGDVIMEWEEWTDAGLMRTFCADKMTTDSAAAATALFGGEKGHIFTIGVTGPVDCCKCTKIPSKNQVKSIFLYAQDRGLSTGLVTTTRVTHATPAGAYAVTQNRDWEMSLPSKLPGTVRCEDIASQLVHHGVNFNVILGGGHSRFYGSPEPETPPVRGKRTDGQNLIRNWISKQAARSRRYAVVFNRTELRLVDTSKTDYLLGLLARSHMQYDLLRNDQPSLEEMTKTAIEILSRNPKGYLLMVEGGRIDHGHHSNKAKIAITETLALEMAVKRSLNLTNPEETLIIVTADHSHAFSLQGYAHRDKSVLDIDDTQNAKDGMSYLISTYTNGPGAELNKTRGNPKLHKRFNEKYRQQALIPLSASTHNPEDVPIYATGPFSDLFRGTMDNTYLAYVAMYSLCIGPYQNESHCVNTMKNSVLIPPNRVCSQSSIIVFTVLFTMWTG